MIPPRIDWTRRLVEALTITLGIRAAFGIDAWWDGVKERRADRESLDAVGRELAATRDLLDTAIELHALTQTQARLVLEMTSTGRPTVSPDSLDVSLWRSYVINPSTGVLDATVQSGAVARLDDEEVEDRLLGWGGLLDARDVENQVATLLLYGQASEYEARTFRDVPVRTLDSLETTLDSPTP